MTVVVWIFALIAAAVHVLVFCWETLLFTRRTSVEPAEALRGE